MLLYLMKKQIILGCEDQSEIDYSMPIRTMLYDALKYTEQQNNLELRKRKDGTYYHSKLRKDNKVLPVLTLIFYYGDKEWTILTTTKAIYSIFSPC